MCNQCYSDCLTCWGTGNTQCSTCRSGGRSPDPSTKLCSSCGSNEYPSGGTCKTCPQNCTACTSETNCTDCSATFTLEDGSCVCAKGTYLGSSGSSCSDCPDSCSECTDSNTCTVCKNNFVLNTSSNSCDCPTTSGFWLDPSSGSYVCQACSQGCSVCSDDTACG